MVSYLYIRSNGMILKVYRIKLSLTNTYIIRYDLHKKNPELPVNPASYLATTTAAITTTADDGSFPPPDHVDNLPDPPPEIKPTPMIEGKVWLPKILVLQSLSNIRLKSCF